MTPETQRRMIEAAMNLASRYPGYQEPSFFSRALQQIGENYTAIVLGSSAVLLGAAYISKAFNHEREHENISFKKYFDQACPYLLTTLAFSWIGKKIL